MTHRHYTLNTDVSFTKLFGLLDFLRQGFISEHDLPDELRGVLTVTPEKHGIVMYQQRLEMEAALAAGECEHLHLEFIPGAVGWKRCLACGARRSPHCGDWVMPQPPCVHARVDVNPDDPEQGFCRDCRSHVPLPAPPPAAPACNHYFDPNSGTWRPIPPPAPPTRAKCAHTRQQFSPSYQAQVCLDCERYLDSDGIWESMA